MVQVHVGITQEPSTPHAVPILVSTKNKYVFAFEEAALETILCNPEFKGHYVSVISIAGTFRRGKSFLLNFFLRYLNAQYVKKDITEWIGKEDQLLTGFKWNRGSKKITDGILIWSEVFTTEINGDKVAIMLMDTQGVWDKSCTNKQCVTIFSLATLLSSVVIYNIMRNIQKDDLQHLQMFAEFGRLISKETNGKPFQKLQILVRDWPWPDEYPYGKNGGDRVLEEWFKNEGNPDDEDSEMQGIRDTIESCFDEYSCYLMPEPGQEVTRNPEFTGCLKNIAREFREELTRFVPMILAPENLIIKTINGEKVTMPSLFDYFKNYIKIYKTDGLPEPMSMFVATAEVNNKTAMEKAMKKYTEMMDKFCGNLRMLHTREELIEIHEKTKETSLETFDSFKKLGGEKYSKPFRDDLEDLIEKELEIYNKINDKKHEKKRQEEDKRMAIIIGMVIGGAAVVSGVTAVWEATAVGSAAVDEAATASVGGATAVVWDAAAAVIAAAGGAAAKTAAAVGGAAAAVGGLASEVAAAVASVSVVDVAVVGAAALGEVAVGAAEALGGVAVRAATSALRIVRAVGGL